MYSFLFISFEAKASVVEPSIKVAATAHLKNDLAELTFFDIFEFSTAFVAVLVRFLIQELIFDKKLIIDILKNITIILFAILIKSRYF